MKFNAFFITFDRIVKLHFTLGSFSVNLVKEAAFEIHGIHSLPLLCLQLPSLVRALLLYSFTVYTILLLQSLAVGEIS